ncbi:MAG: hypothetical protein QF362_00520 [Candidatus Woesearchaeota archaeon]|jgi:hypothetical protein|nr:hypothetical protein [Candidatus Woesearchaeota archaeon]MDP7505914.1 hypothetical protein [Candidatus Woesearchaeota archaeon]|tara:strand:- start:2655 stop:3044 length:390 start_codon:yes stop_codon:yes gene_type:complete
MKQKVPPSLRVWFLIHFVVDMLFAIPLIINPVWFLRLVGFGVVEPFATRLVGAALIGIGGVSLAAHKAGVETFNSLLTLKILWSFSAMLGIILTLIQGGSKVGWFILAMFFVFSGVWVYYKKRINKKIN